MPPRRYFADKQCRHCHSPFNRWERQGKREATTDFEERQFCSVSCANDWRVGENHPLFKPEGSRRPDGYIRVARDKKRVYLHRDVMERHLGRALESNEHVHHKDGNPENNLITNLELTNNSQHLKMHYIERQANGEINGKGQFA